MNDITKFVYKESDDSNIFYADFENYETGTVNTQGFESGDMVLFTWEDKKYRGVLRQSSYDSNDGLFEITNVKERI
jgi:hypothetical protein